MSKAKKSHAKKNPHCISSYLARNIRGLVTSLTIPTLMTACAPVPHHSASQSQSSNGSAGKTILYVEVPEKSEAQAGEAKVAKDEEAKRAYEDWRSPANQYIPLTSDLSIFEKVLSKYKVSAAETAEKKKASKKEYPLNVKRFGITPPVEIAPMAGIKPGKDGLWSRVRKRLMLTAFEQEQVLAEVEKIKRAPGAVSFLSKKAEPFLFYIVDEIERRGLPMDLALVPMVESAFQPTAVSPKQAAGIWQFIPSTATNYGLKLVDGYDGRFDIYASTKAALKYFSKLQAQFNGDWLLALAAYNAGEGAVTRAIAANQKAGLGTSFWELNLPAETKAYVPKILALSKVIGDPASHGVNLHRISSLPYLARVEVNSPLQLSQVASNMGMTWEEFASLNPAFKADAVPPPPYNLLLPVDKAQILVENLQVQGQQGVRLVAARKYVVKKGETLVVIAKQQGVPPLKLAEWNGLNTNSKVKPGQELIIFPV